MLVVLGAGGGGWGRGLGCLFCFPGVGCEELFRLGEG